MAGGEKATHHLNRQGLYLLKRVLNNMLSMSINPHCRLQKLLVLFHLKDVVAVSLSLCDIVLFFIMMEEQGSGFVTLLISISKICSVVG